MAAKYKGLINEDQLKIILERRVKFLDALSNPAVPPVRVFDPLNDDLLDQIKMVREISKYLQQKKEEDMNAAEAAKRVEETQKIEEATGTPDETENTTEDK